ncbi:MAG: DUF1080 domain-containing protein [Opitutales bacterium]|nr:DUF1080 domain-containing protein [Opitutales bacterium]
MKNLKTALTLCAAAILPAAAFAQTPNAQARTVELFNGKNLDGWNLYLEPSETADRSEIFRAKDGVIEIAGLPMGFIYTKEKYSDFKLHVEWLYPEKPSNSGIFLFVQEPGEKLWPNAIECQLCAGAAGDFVLINGADVEEYKLPEGKERPQFPVIGKFAPSNEKHPGQWNSADIVCLNGEITVYINGTFQNRAHAKVKSGYIALQGEGGKILFRNVRLTPLK